jgi:hypothetical protein
MTVLRLYESIELPVEFNPDPITAPYTGKPIDEIVIGFQNFLNL